MSSTAQVLSNRENSLKSTGPRTPEGKLPASRNGISHGLTAAGDPVLPHEDRTAFNSLLKRYKSDFTPATEHESFLVTEMVGARWRLDRAGRIESAMLEDIVDPSNATSTPEMKMAKAMMQNGGDPFARMDRHRANLERSYHRCARELRAAKKANIGQTAQHLAEEKYCKLLDKLIEQQRPPTIDRPISPYFRTKANPATAPAQNDERKANVTGPISL